MAKLHVQGNDLYYEIVGEGEPIVFIHGLGSSTRDWELQTEYFSRLYQVVTLDIRGHGRSDKPPGPYSVPLFASDTAGLIEALDLAPAHIVGISMGGMIGLQLVVDHPELVKSLVVVNSGADLVARTLKERIQVYQRFLIVRVLGMRKMGEVLSGRLFPKPEHDEIQELFVERWAENDPKAYRDAMKALVGWSVRDRLGEIEKPVLVIAADQDYTSVESKQEYVTLMKDAELVVIEDSRHATPVEQPEAFNQALEKFLARQR